MKTTRRIMSLVLALMMFLSLSVVAFADEVEAPYVHIVGGGLDLKYQATEDDTVYNALVGDTNIKWTTVTDYYDASKTHQALTSIYGVGSAGIQNNDTDKAKLPLPKGCHKPRREQKLEFLARKNGCQPGSSPVTYK